MPHVVIRHHSPLCDRRGYREPGLVLSRSLRHLLAVCETPHHTCAGWTGCSDAAGDTLRRLHGTHNGVSAIEYSLAALRQHAPRWRP